MEKNDQLMFSLILQYQQLGMMALGKLARPGEGVHRDLTEASFFIDILAMLEEKTRGNLPDELGRILKTTVSDLRLNYVEEARRDDAKPVQPASESADSSKAADSAVEAETGPTP